MLHKLIDRICQLFSYLMVACLAAMVVMVFGNVVLRYGFNSGITASEELSRWLFVWMTYLGAVVALRNRAHLGTDSVVSRLPPAGRKLPRGRPSAGCWPCGLLLQGGWKQAVINYPSTSAVMEASMAWFYGSGVVFAVLAALVIAHELWLLVRGGNGEPA